MTSAPLGRPSRASGDGPHATAPATSRNEKRFTSAMLRGTSGDSSLSAERAGPAGPGGEAHRGEDGDVVDAVLGGSERQRGIAHERLDMLDHVEVVVGPRDGVAARPL